MTEHLAVDHVLIAVGDLTRAAAALETRYGLTSIVGGRHRAWGTANRIVPLGATYLELIAVDDPPAAAASGIGRWVTRTVPGTPAGWAVRTIDIEAVAARLGLTVVSGSRTAPDGRVLTWRTAGVDEAAAEPALPFFIEWGPSVPHPGRGRVAHPAGSVTLARVLVSGDERRLARWLRGADLPVGVAAGPPRVVSVALDSARGRIVLP